MLLFDLGSALVSGMEEADPIKDNDSGMLKLLFLQIPTLRMLAIEE